MKLLRPSIESALSSTFFSDLKIETKWLSKHTRAAPLIPVSGRTESMYISQVAAMKHTELKSS